jgi:hypothetical protein
MKRLLVLLVIAALSVACGGVTIDPLLDGGGDAYSPDTGKDSSEPFACGTSTCGGDQICIHPCCGGAPPACEPLQDGGTCPAGFTISNQCYNFGTGGTTGCEPPPCTPPPPYCAPSGTSNTCGLQNDSHDCYEACG